MVYFVTLYENFPALLQVSTYALLVDDVLEVFSDTVIVHDAAVSRLQRLTKVGLTDSAFLLGFTVSAIMHE